MMNKFSGPWFLSLALFLIPLSLFSQGDLEKRTLMHQDRERVYFVHFPDRYEGYEGRPLVIMLHGAKGSAMQVARYSQLDEFSDRDGFISVYPQGYKRSWADARGTTRASEAGIDDVGFISKMIDEVVREWKGDPEKVYVAGISNGGFMAFRLACELRGKIRAIAPGCATLPVGGVKQCSPDDGIPVMLINGTEDPLVPYGGGEVQSKAGGKILSTDSTCKYFAGLNQAGKYEVLDRRDEEDDDTRVRVHTWSGEESAPEVVLYEIIGGGHAWPGCPQYLPKAMIGTASREFHGVEQICNFFKELD